MRIHVTDLMEKELQDDVLVFETDTVYGIGCLLNSEQGVKRIYDIKKRDGKKPLAVLCANLEQVKMLVNCDEKYLYYGKKYWPGALTLVLPKKDIVGDFLTSGFDTVGVRIPNDEIALTILRKFGPMAVTSLNLSSEPAILTYQKALEYENKVDYLVDGTDLNSLSSTVYDPVNNRVFRQGEIKIN